MPSVRGISGRFIVHRHGGGDRCVSVDDGLSSIETVERGRRSINKSARGDCEWKSEAKMEMMEKGSNQKRISEEDGREKKNESEGIGDDDG